MEGMMRQNQGQNPAFRFLFAGPENDYYRWRMFVKQMSLTDGMPSPPSPHVLACASHHLT